MNRRTRLLLALLWALVILYPSPTMLLASIARSISPSIDADAARQLASTLPDDPNVIRDMVLTKYVVYDYDWNVYHVPWYFPSTPEVLRNGRGDCEGQAVLLASILKAKGIPYELKITLDHIWVDYEGKPENEIENAALEIFRRTEDSLQVKVPEKFSLRRYLEIQADARWHPMPLDRKLLLIIGTVLICAGNLMQQAIACSAGIFRAARVQVRELLT